VQALAPVVQSPHQEGGSRMKKQTSLGDFISALYDTLDTEDSPATSQVVTACTLQVLLRQRNSRVIAELFEPAETVAVH